jgi:hypothetical protein
MVQPPHPTYRPDGVRGSKTPSVNRVVTNRNRAQVYGWVHVLPVVTDVSSLKKKHPVGPGP